MCGAILTTCLLVSSAQAIDRFGPGIGLRGFHRGQHFPGYGFESGFFGYRSSSSLYGLGYIPVPPYYALHPPVYYSHPVPYPYGASPFARLPARGFEIDVSPRPIVNPYIPLGTETLPESEAPVETEATASAPKLIANPFYTAPETELAQAQ